MKKKKLIMLVIILLLAGFVWVKYLKQGNYVKVFDIGDEEFVDGSEYVESGEYYFNCRKALFVKRVPPELDANRLKNGKFPIWTNERDAAQKDILQKYMGTPGWETGFEYLCTERGSGIYRQQPRTHLFKKYVIIDGKNYAITIEQPFNIGKRFGISFYKTYKPRMNDKTYFDYAEEAKYSCPDPQ